MIPNTPHMHSRIITVNYTEYYSLNHIEIFVRYISVVGIAMTYCLEVNVGISVGECLSSTGENHQKNVIYESSSCRRHSQRDAVTPRGDLQPAFIYVNVQTRETLLLNTIQTPETRVSLVLKPLVLRISIDLTRRDCVPHHHEINEHIIFFSSPLFLFAST